MLEQKSHLMDTASFFILNLPMMANSHFKAAVCHQCLDDDLLTVLRILLPDDSVLHSNWWPYINTDGFTKISVLIESMD